MSGDDSLGGYQGAIQPYMFEPVDDNVAQYEDESEPDDNSARLQQDIGEWYVSLFIVVIKHRMALLKFTLFLMEQLALKPSRYKSNGYFRPTALLCLKVQIC